MTRAQPSTPRIPAVLALSTGCHALVALQVFTVPAIAPAMAAGMGVSGWLVGAQVLLVYLAAMISSLFAGSMVVRIGAIRATQLSIIGSAIGLGIAAVPSIAVVAIASLILGASYGLVNPATAQMLEIAAQSDRRSLVFSIKQSAVPVGGVLAGVIAPLVTVSLGWQGALVTIAIVSVAGAALLQITRRWFPFRRLPSTKARFRAFQDVEVVWRVSALRYLCLAAACFAGLQLILTTYLVTMLVQNVGIGLVAAGIGLSFFNSGGIVGRFGWGLAADAIRSGALIVTAAYGISAALLVAFPFMKADWSVSAIFAFVAVLGMVAAGWNGVFIGEVMRLAPPGESARAIAGSFAIAFAGSLTGIGSFVLGFQLLRDYGTATWIVSAMALVGFLFSLKALALMRARGG